MSELRVNGKSEDGQYLSLLDSDGKEFSVRISDTLRSTVNQPRLISVQEDEVAPISVKEIQRRLRTGESPESIAQDGNITVEKVQRFSGPILQERQFIIDQAGSVIVRKEPGREPVNFGDAIILRLAPRGVDVTQINYNCWRIETGIWTIQVSYPTSDRPGVGQWEYDPTRRSLNALDDNARWLLGEETPAPRAPLEPGLIYTEQVERNPRAAEPVRETPRLVSIRSDVDAESAKDGVQGRAKVPSWDEIMFGQKKDED
jgi:hypothetical protein